MAGEEATSVCASTSCALLQLYVEIQAVQNMVSRSLRQKKGATTTKERRRAKKKYFSQQIMGYSLEKWGWTFETEVLLEIHTPLSPCIIEILKMNLIFLEEPYVWHIFTHTYHKRQLDVDKYAIRGSFGYCFPRNDVLGKNKHFSFEKLWEDDFCPPKKTKKRFWNTSRFIYNVVSMVCLLGSNLRAGSGMGGGLYTLRFPL